MKRIKEWAKYLLLQVIIPNVIWIIIISIPSAITGLIFFTKAVIDFAKNKAGYKTLFIVQLVAAGICILTLIADIIYLVYRFFYRKNHPVFPTIESKYKITYSEQEFFFRDREHIVFRQHIDFVSLKEDLKHFEHTYYWSGQKYIKTILTSGTERGVTVTDTNRTSSPYTISVDFPREIGYNQMDNYCLETHVKDENHSMIPYLGKIVKCATKSIKLKVTAPIGMIHNVRALVSTDYSGDIILEPEKKLNPSKVGDNEVFEYSWNDLDLLHCYTLVWDFIDDN